MYFKFVFLSETQFFFSIYVILPFQKKLSKATLMYVPFENLKEYDTIVMKFFCSLKYDDGFICVS